MFKGIIFVLFLAIFVTGCSVKNSIPVEYHTKPLNIQNANNSNSVGITKWSDKRSVTSVKDPLSEKAVMRMGPATIGITNNGQEFVRVADFIRDNFIKELQSLGVNVKPIDLIPVSDDRDLLKNIANNNNVNFVISGELLNFDINCHGSWTLECTRNVNFVLTMVDKLGDKIITRELFSSVMANNEGMGVLHKTLLDQLTNEVLREALFKAISTTIKEINKH